MNLLTQEIPLGPAAQYVTPPTTDKEFEIHVEGTREGVVRQAIGEFFTGELMECEYAKIRRDTFIIYVKPLIGHVSIMGVAKRFKQLYQDLTVFVNGQPVYAF